MASLVPHRRFPSRPRSSCENNWRSRAERLPELPERF